MQNFQYTFEARNQSFIIYQIYHQINFSRCVYYTGRQSFSKSQLHMIFLLILALCDLLNSNLKTVQLYMH